MYFERRECSQSFFTDELVLKPESQLSDCLLIYIICQLRIQCDFDLVVNVYIEHDPHTDVNTFGSSRYVGPSHPLSSSLNPNDIVQPLTFLCFYIEEEYCGNFSCTVRLLSVSARYYCLPKSDHDHKCSLVRQHPYP